MISKNYQTFTTLWVVNPAHWSVKAQTKQQNVVIANVLIFFYVICIRSIWFLDCWVVITSLLSSVVQHGGLAQMVERSLSMREVPGSMPGSSTYEIHFCVIFLFLNLLRSHRCWCTQRWCPLPCSAIVSTYYIFCTCIALFCKSSWTHVRMAERSKAPDSRDSLFLWDKGAFWSTNVGVGSNPTSDTDFPSTLLDFVC